MELINEWFGKGAPYVVAFVGSLLYNLLLFLAAKNNCDKIGKDFEYGKYAKMNWDNWLAAFCMAPVIVWYRHDILTIINSTFGLSLPDLEIYTIAAGVVVELAMFGIAKLVGWKESFVAPIHKN